MLRRVRIARPLFLSQKGFFMASAYRYFTTPIYYATGNPHAGHMYTTILASILKHHYQHRGQDVRLLTGLDEHGEAVQETAQKQELSPQALVDAMAQEWEKQFSRFEIDYDIFMRTTHPDHIKNVTEILNYCYQKGDIYFGEHNGYYCVKCEGFLTVQEQDEHHSCLVHKRPAQLRQEKNYFFRTSKYRQQVLSLISSGHLCSQERYKNELLAMADHLLDSDLSISRPRARLSWGIPLPFDQDHVAYVWFDALPNYITGVGGLQAAKTTPYWKNVFHLLGKDIIKFHGIFWPALCLSLDLPVPKLLVTGWLLKDSHKMSKSLANVVTTDELLHYGRDMFVNFVFRTSNPGEDLDISWPIYFERYNSELANGIGNLLARTLTMAKKYCQNTIPYFHQNSLLPEQKEIEQSSTQALFSIEKAFDSFAIADALAQISFLVRLVDKHIAAQKPWELASQKEHSSSAHIQLENILATSCAVLRVIGYATLAFFPKKMKELLESLSEDTSCFSNSFAKAKKFFSISSGAKIHTVPKLYARIDIQAELKKLEQNTAASCPNLLSTQSKMNDLNFSCVTLDDFSKMHIRTATVISAQHVEGSQKLLRIVVSLGELGEKQIFSALRQWVSPEEIINRKVLVLTNLVPRKMKFGISEAMILSAETLDHQVHPVYVSENLKEGDLLS